jgi:outer membrane protein assembly factor BamB
MKAALPLRPVAPWLASMAAALVATAVFAEAAPPDFGPQSWTQYRAGPTRNAVVETGGPLPQGGIARNFATDDQVRDNPVVIGNQLYVGNHDSGSLNCFDLATGKLLWHAKAPNWVHSDMIDDGRTVYVGFGNRDFPSQTIRGTGKSGVMALNRYTGDIDWTFFTSGTGMPTPIYRDGIVYMATGGGLLYALDATTGTLQWKVKLPGWVSMSAPALKRNLIYVGTNDSLTAVDINTRGIAWMFRDYGSFTDVPPAIGPDETGSDTVVITAVKHADKVTREEKATYHTSPTAEHHFIYAFDTIGMLKWKDLLGHGQEQDNNTSGAPAIADGKVFVGSPYTNTVYAYDLADGTQLWHFAVGAKVKGAPAIAGGKVYFGDTKGRLHVLDEATGTQLAVTQLGDKPLAPAGPVIVNGEIFISSQDGHVYARPLAEIDAGTADGQPTPAPGAVPAP